MRTIHKYTLECSQSLRLPTGYQVLSAHGQHGKICIWVDIDPDEITIDTVFFDVLPTGDVIDEGIERKYIGTALIHDGNYVFHVYERIVQ